MLTLFQAPAYSNLREQRLLTQLKRVVPVIVQLETEKVFFIQSKSTLSEKEQATLKSLLSAKTDTVWPEKKAHEKIIVIPAENKCSGWALEVLEILPLCGLSNIKRIEQADILYLKLKTPLNEKQFKALCHFCCDPNQQQCVTDLEQAQAQLALNFKSKTTLNKPAALNLDSESHLEQSLLSASVLEQLKPVYQEDSPIHIEIRSAECPGQYVTNLISKAMFSGYYLTDLKLPEHKIKDQITPLETLIHSSKQVAIFFNQLGLPQISGFLRTLALSQSNLRYDPPLLLTGFLQAHSQSFEDKPLSELNWMDQEQFIFSKSHLTQTVKPIEVTLEEIIVRLLELPSIMDKSFLINLQDSSITGCVVQNSLVGPWQIPVADCGLILDPTQPPQGEAISIGERPFSAFIDPAASARMALAEAITNIAGADLGQLEDLSLFASWIADSDLSTETADLMQSVGTLAHDLCENLNLRINFTTRKQASAPLTLVVNAHAKVLNAYHTLTPVLKRSEQTCLLLIDLAHGKQRMGGSCFAQVSDQIGKTVPDLERTETLRYFFSCIQDLKKRNLLLAYHDRSDGGLLIALCEMAFCSHVGLAIDISDLGTDPKNALFNEELGVIVQIKEHDLELVLSILESYFLKGFEVARLDLEDKISISQADDILFARPRIFLQRIWSKMSFEIQSLRDNPRTAESQFDLILDQDDPGLNTHVPFKLDDLQQQFAKINTNCKPKIALLQEQGCIGFQEMQRAFEWVGFEVSLLPMDDLVAKTQTLEQFEGLVIGGGFSFGDVLGAGQAWGKRILFSSALCDQFFTFFQDPKKFVLGIGNGCQMLSVLKVLMPKAAHWPCFKENISEQFESRLTLVEVQPTPSIFFEGLQGAQLKVPVAHQYGQAVFENELQSEMLIKQHLLSLCFVDGRGRKTGRYPANPNGSWLGMCGFTNGDGRLTILMPHPERLLFDVQDPLNTEQTRPYGSWLKCFMNLKTWLD